MKVIVVFVLLFLGVASIVEHQPVLFAVSMVSLFTFFLGQSLGRDEK